MAGKTSAPSHKFLRCIKNRLILQILQPFSPVFHNCLTPLVDSLSPLKVPPEQCRVTLVSVPVGTHLAVGRLPARPQVFNGYGTFQRRKPGMSEVMV